MCAALAGAAILAISAVVVTLLAPGNTRLDGWFIDGAILAGAALAGLRGFLVPANRAEWWSLAAALCVWAIGDRYYFAELAGQADPPIPSPADPFYLSFYPLAALWLVLGIRRRSRGMPGELVVDALIGVLSVSAIVAAVVFPDVLTVAGGDTAKVLTNLAYPVGDLFLIGLLVSGALLTGHRPGPSWLLGALGLVLFVAADSIYLYQTAAGTYQAAMPLDALWSLGAVLMGAAAWARAQREDAARRSWSTLIPLIAFAAAAFALEIVDDWGTPLEPAAHVLAVATLVLVVARLAWVLVVNRRLVSARDHDAVTDELTGLHNRRALMRDLDAWIDRAASPERRTVAMFDLNHFKDYNDTFGHAAGDHLLRRLGAKLDGAVSGRALAYRLGGDEFCVVTDPGVAHPRDVVDAGRRALSERGEGFHVTCEAGMAIVPEEATDRTQALRLADERMYAEKRRRPEAAEEQATGGLLRALAERDPALTAHLQETVRLAEAVGRSLDMDEDQIEVLKRATELHDIGKMAIPDSVLLKPGPLTASERRLLHQHPLIGERIINAVPALRPVGSIVRSTGQHFDDVAHGARGAIPLASRIVAACAAYDSMTAGRPYRPPRTSADAIAELRRCAGTQFDPVVVDAVADSVRALAKVGGTAVQ